MALDVQRNGDDVKVRFRGDIDLINMHSLKNLLFSLTADDVNINLDASEVDFLDSSGIGMLILVKKMQNARKRSFRILNMPDSTKRGISNGMLDLLLE